MNFSLITTCKGVYKTHPYYDYEIYKIPPINPLPLLSRFKKINHLTANQTT